MAAQTYSTLQNSLAAMLSQAAAPYTILPSDFITLYPQAISYAEDRIYREMVPVSNRQQDTSLLTTAASRVLDLTPIMPLVVEGFALLYPAGVTSIDAGTQIPFDEASLDLLDICWPQSSVTVDPSLAQWYGLYWAMRDATTIVFGPTVAAAYTPVVTGLFQPAPMSVTNPTTYLGNVYPELLQAGCMVFLSGALLRNFGASSDDPKMAVAWESQFQTLMKSAIEEEQRRRGQGVGWTANMPAPIARSDRS